jgi:predicted NAD/FAD-dependent oxidoreductase
MSAQPSPTVAVIGAGLAGLVVARRLRQLAEVTIYEKSRGAGGRMATRRAGDFEFDHGAQFFTARTNAFLEFLQPLISEGVIANWRAGFATLDRNGTREQRSWDDSSPHFVGTPAMNRIGKSLADGLNVVLETHIENIARRDGLWSLIDDHGNELGRFDWVVLTAPAPQTAVLGRELPALVELCGTRTMRGCFAMMLGFAEPLQLPWQAALVRDADVSWISVNSSKPGRQSPFTLVVHSTNAWADAHIEQDTDEVLEHLLAEASSVTGEKLDTAVHRQVHRWRFANIDKQPGPAFFLDDDARVAACGDWFVRGRIESAFTSADKLAMRLRERL